MPLSIGETKGNMKFFYTEGNDYRRQRHYISLRRGAPEWCNLDCPVIYVDGDPERFAGWRLSTGLTLEDGNSDLAEQFLRFVLLSSKAFYQKYPQCFQPKRGNGFWKNAMGHNPVHYATALKVLEDHGQTQFELQL
jgi:hypothetical protein